MEPDFSEITTEIVKDLFAQKFNCAQIVFAHGAYYLGFDIESALKITTPFGGGIRCGGVCGAATGAFMSIGLKYGVSQPNDVEQARIAHAKQDLFKEKFIAIHQHINCADLLGGLSFGNPDDQAKIASSGITAKLCPQIVADACDILDEILADD